MMYTYTEDLQLLIDFARDQGHEDHEQAAARLERAIRQGLTDYVVSGEAPKAD
jgi:hypothetical protein